ncbi:MarR family protein [Tamaricihabitans halophyticus]|uniref:MarR family protein n=1 Tax=Tamaricihabitans halophyticus TaxID=1262583 RepID=A0A4R2R5D5_9PSEU|nr:MarR family transcriptional regulator [Tamaricihabitans halophyticus]TCP56958.1 MarR family protein [Tamaricihabitans halophyticus]
MASDQHERRRFVENAALLLSDAGFPRMPARVFSAVLASEPGSLTAAEIAEFLQVSPAAVSGAVRYLTQIQMLNRERTPGERRDHYSVLDNQWHQMFLDRDQILDAWATRLAEGIDVVGPDTAAGTRLRETAEFLEYLGKELTTIYERWAASRGSATD